MFKLINKLKNRKGFTLIELIVVLAVLAIIMAIAVPRFLGVQEKAKKDADAQTIKMIGKAAELYYVQHDESITGISSADDLVDDYLDSIELKSGDYGNTNGSDLTISTSSGAIIIKKGTSEVYPTNNLD